MESKNSTQCLIYLTHKAMVISFIALILSY